MIIPLPIRANTPGNETSFVTTCTEAEENAGECTRFRIPIDRVPYQPDRTGSIAASFAWPEAVSLAVQASYTGSMLIQQFGDSFFGDDFETKNQLLPDMRHVPSFWLLNFSFDMPVGKHMELVGGVDNLTDYVQDDLGDQSTDYNWGPLAGRSWRMGVRYTYR